MITIETSQRTASFYNKNGFTAVNIIAKDISDGLDKYFMKIDKDLKSHIVRFYYIFLSNYIA
ncbi:hypothetical protein P2W68_01025 [Chryseobacterium arthrosphaerae]|uniref:hypothetical protein n=1 Tax=Chryseobacterium arthrosphaerae TaxID=651561 RepID=UPI0023E27383|nr:hypothetical protein [Chryseobacterium arthrosphaerae]WES98208.1 hypothetical protein P2W68_01025 [Chryseobacterium arthrosphaerae]